MTVPISSLRDLVIARKRPASRKVGLLTQDAIDTILGELALFSLPETTDQSIAHRSHGGLSVNNDDLLECGYRQFALQRVLPGDDPTDYQNFVLPIHDDLIAPLVRSVGPICRTRIGVMPAGGMLDWHVDPGNQQRFICLLQGSHKVQLNVDGQEEDVPMGIGEVWAINTAWPHKVANTGTVDRIALLGMFHTEVLS